MDWRQAKTRGMRVQPPTGHEVGDCDVTEEELVAYAEGDLGGARGEWVATHLAVCPHCRERAALSAAVDQLLRDMPAPTVDPARAAWMRAYVAGDAARRARSRWWSVHPVLRRYHPRWPGAFTVALGCKITLLVLLWWPGSGLTLVQVRAPLALLTLAVVISLTPLRQRRTK